MCQYESLPTCFTAHLSNDHGKSEQNQLSLIVRTPINLIRRLISPVLIKDPWIMPLRPKTSEMAKEQERKVALPGVKPRAISLPRQLLCH